MEDGKKKFEKVSPLAVFEAMNNKCQIHACERIVRGVKKGRSEMSRRQWRKFG